MAVQSIFSGSPDQIIFRHTSHNRIAIFRFNKKTCTCFWIRFGKFLKLLHGGYRGCVLFLFMSLFINRFTLWFKLWFILWFVLRFTLWFKLRFIFTVILNHKTIYFILCRKIPTARFPFDEPICSKLVSRSL